jgi:cyclic beta-1,2-glucan synthetase
LAVNLAQTGPPGSREGCVAYYLVDDGLPELEKRLRRHIPWRERRLRFLRRYPALVYLGSLAALTAGVSSTFLFAAHRSGIVSPGMLLFLGILALFPASELATYLLQVFLTWILPPRVLPKMSFEEGIPEDCRTLVVVPMMLLTPESVRGEIEKLEVRYFANPDPNLWFSLLSDFTDAEQREMPEDDALLGLAMKGIEQLNSRHGKGRFLLFHRPRVWCETEGRWIGWERKRGKLEELNALLNGGASTDSCASGRCRRESGT